MDMLAASITAFRATWIFLTPSTLRLLYPIEVTTLHPDTCYGRRRVDRTLFETWAPLLNLMEVCCPSETAVYAQTALVKSHGQDPSNTGFPVDVESR